MEQSIIEEANNADSRFFGLDLRVIFWRLISAIICIAGFYYALPKMQMGIGNNVALMFGIIAAVALWMLDFAISNSAQENSKKDSLTFLSVTRMLFSAVVAWVAAYGLTIVFMWDTFNIYRPMARSQQYINTFLNMIGVETSAFSLFVILVVSIFLVDAFGRLMQISNRQVEVVRQQEQTIAEQVSVIKDSEAKLNIADRTYLTQIRSTQHELGGKLMTAKNTVLDLQSSLANYDGFKLQDKIRRPLPGEASHDIDNFQDLINRLANSVNYSLGVLQNMRELVSGDPSSFKPEPVYILQWLKNEARKLQHPGESVSVIGDEVRMQIDPAQMRILLNNVIENARRHGFTGSSEKPKILLETKSYNGNLFLSCHNSGNALPPGLTTDEYVSPGTVAGNTGNSGIGGYLVGMIANNHNAELSIEPSHETGYATVVRLTIPVVEP